MPLMLKASRNSIQLANSKMRDTFAPEAHQPMAEYDNATSEVTVA